MRVLHGLAAQSSAAEARKWRRGSTFFGMSRVFLDTAAGQPLSQAAQEVFEQARSRGWAAPTGNYFEAKQSQLLLEAAKQTVGIVTDRDAAGVVFLPQTAAADIAISAISGCEDGQINAAKVSAGLALAIEREKYLHGLARTAALLDISTCQIPVDSYGRVSSQRLRDLLERDSLLVLQAGNLEVGTTQDLDMVGEVVQDAQASWVCDATGSLGFGQIPAATAVIADASAFGGPASTSVALLPPGVSRSIAHREIDPLSAAMAAAALHDSVATGAAASDRQWTLTAKLIDDVLDRVPDAALLGHPRQRLPQVAAFTFLYVDGERLASDLDRLGFAVGSGSACATRTGLPSHVLSAIGAVTHGNVRIGLGPATTEQDVNRFVAALADCVERNRRDA